ncbi:hypothetical protein [Streptomyces turgidiscabies]|uniref:Uncharacterized protein n=1 Tax=Streptomyces turgidiscabies TaxID=85558 RepID=A0ABU0RNY4_9ACTN|nr:hypothetical protein [Streptomyces turgidiscabies]MDQ0933698.1 hypothetical protein [Streptomyces turgidiscabies]
MTWDQAAMVARLLPGVVRRVLGGGEPQPWWLPRRVLTVVSADVDTGTGVGAVWMVWRPQSAGAREYGEILEWYDGRWRSLGGGSSEAGDLVDVEVIEVRVSGGSLSLTRHSDPPRSFETAPWITCAHVYLGRDVGHVLVGDRRFEVPEQRRFVVVWKGPQIGRGVRPVIVALGRDGTELSRIGPLDSLDSHTWGRVRRELGEGREGEESGESGELG